MASARQTLPWLVIEGFQTEQRQHLAVTQETLRQYDQPLPLGVRVCFGI